MHLVLQDSAFRNIFNAVHDGILISDPATGKYVEANENGCAMFGYSKAELIGCDIGMLSSGIAPYTRDTALENGRNAILGRAKLFEWQCKTKDGRLFWAEISNSVVDIGECSCIVKTVRDISERKRLDNKLSVAMDKMSAANEAKSHFLASMSHELRTPLNAIIGFSDLILSQPLGSLDHARYREYIGDIHDSGEHLLALINDVLDIARLDAGRVDIADDRIFLPDLIMDACRMVSPQVGEAQLRIVTDLPATLPALRGDARRIRQILLNLLSNAIKFTPAGGSVSIAAQETSNGLEVSIRDTGIGIAKEDLPAVMQRFGQIDSHISRKHPGSGLGLPLSKQLAELHGGSISIESKIGVGTVVAVSFPRERILAATTSAAAA